MLPHFTSTVTSSTRGPGGVGSYLARQVTHGLLCTADVACGPFDVSGGLFDVSGGLFDVSGGLFDASCGPYDVDGSHSAVQEFGSTEAQPGPDSGYVSHGSGGGYPKLLMQQVSF